MNLLIEKAPGYIVIGGKKERINTSFDIWIKFFIACEKCDGEAMESVIKDIFVDGMPQADIKETAEGCLKWLFPDNKCKNEGGSSENEGGTQAFDFSIDGNVIYCELWEYFPHLMQRGMTFHEGMQAVKLLLCNEDTLLWHRAFARCGDFSKMNKEQKRYWEKERAKYRLPIKNEEKNQREIDRVFSKAF